MAKKETQPQEEPKPFEKRQPILEVKIEKSNDGKWVIHKTVITDIKPTSYYEKVINGG
jgi:hypothetical protein